MSRLALAAALALAATPAATCTDRALLILDASGSMMETDPGTRVNRHERAARALSLALPDATAQREIGLMVYGPGGHDACSGIALKVEPHKDSAAEILGHVHAAEPFGLTPIQTALEMAAVAMDYQTAPATLVLVTDGAETCSGDPCSMAKALSAQSAGLQIHVVGFQVRPEMHGGETASALACIADVTGGRYIEAGDVESLSAALSETLGCLLLVGRVRGEGA